MPLEPRDDDWLEATALSSVSGLLSDGFTASATAEGATHRWQLSSGRPFFVFAHETGLGWINQPRLQLGRRQFVIAAAAEVDRVRTVLAESCTGEIPSPGEPGSLPGWAVLGTVTPATAPRAVEGDVFGNVLRPLPDVSISLEDGLWLRGNEWLDGFGPRIRLLGQLPAGESLFIDGVQASADPEGNFSTASSQSPGAHAVQCLGASASYSISAAPVEWPQLPPEEHGMEPLEPKAGSVLVSVPSTNPLLLGARPGEWFVCSRRPGSTWTGYVGFEPVWALPADAAHSNRATDRVLSLRTKAVVADRTDNGRSRPAQADITRWYLAILASRGKRLEVQPAAGRDLWKDYTDEADRQRRNRR